jgi:ABC-type transport system involved in multi-copper enzyme maturation permease subunit
MVITSEYSSGMIRSTLAEVPGRLSVLWAKAAVVAGVTFPVMLLTASAAFFAGQPLIGAGDIVTASIGDPGVLDAIVGTAGYLTGAALMGLAVGALLRSTAAAISTLFAVIFLLPGLGMLLPESIRDSVLRFFPSSAGESFMSVFAAPGQLGTGAGIAVFVAWVAVPLVAAAVALKRRNA